MNLITAANISKHLGERQLLQDADLLINDGDRIGLIGVNGSGKSTLLRLLAQMEPPDTGSVTVWGGVRIELLPQEPVLDEGATALGVVFGSDSPQLQLRRRYDHLSDELNAAPDDETLQAELARLAAEMERLDAWAAEANAKALLTRLGVIEFEKPVSQLSGGQRKRVALARALIHRADVLMLDEPTNHLDAETIIWLEDYVRNMPGALLVVTHDRYFLDRVVNRIVELDRRQLVSYPGNYSAYLEQRSRRQEQLAALEQKRQKLLQRELEWVRRSPMARGTKQKARKQRVDELLQLRYDSGEETVSMALAARRLGKRALAAHSLTKRYHGQTVVDQVSVRMEPGDRLGISGPNGAGKSTLLDMLAGKTAPDEGGLHWGETVRIGYYDQLGEHLDEDVTLLEFIEEEAVLIRNEAGERVEAAKMLEWFLFPRSLQRATIRSLSGGERRRLYLLRTLVHQPNVLLLDEPTNDLDIQTLNVLEEFLDRFNGCLIVVSHDRYFLDRTVDYVRFMEDGKLGPQFPGPYETASRLRRELATQEEPGAPAAPEKTPTRAATHSVRKLTWSEQRELEALESQIHVLEHDKVALMQEMAAAGEDYVMLQRLARRVDVIDGRLATAEERWLELSEIAELAAQG